MKFDKVHCYFERSGTFKNAFRKLGYEAFDYDIVDSPEVNYCIDIFKEIKLWGTSPKETYFNYIDKEDLVFAFFPCTYFSDQSQLLSRGDSFGQKTWSLAEKISYSWQQMEMRENYFKYLCWFVEIALEKGFKLIIENPKGKVNFLKQFFPIKPEIIINDRTKLGDCFRKPTQFFFVNCHPAFNLANDYYIDDEKRKVVQDIRGFDRSVISPIFAENFIKTFILE